MRPASALPLSTLALRALAAQRAAHPSLAAAAAAGAPLRLHPSLLALHGLPAQPVVNPATLPRAARAASRAARLPPSVRPGHWALPAGVPPKAALRLATALALRLPAPLRSQGPDLPLLLQEVLRQLARSLAEPGHAKSEAKTWPALRALAPAVQACVSGALLGDAASGREGSLASAEFALAQREAQAGALVARFLRLLAAFTGEAPGAAPGGAPSPRLALALQLYTALPPSAAAQCAPALQALRARLGELEA